MVSKSTNPEVYKNTVIIIAADNGTESGTTNAHEYISQYRGTGIPRGKITFDSRGSRVPFIIRWPGQIQTGFYNGLTDFADIFCSITDIAGVECTGNTQG